MEKKKKPWALNFNEGVLIDIYLPSFLMIRVNYNLPTCGLAEI